MKISISLQNYLSNWFPVATLDHKLQATRIVSLSTFLFVAEVGLWSLQKIGIPSMGWGLGKDRVSGGDQAPPVKWKLAEGIAPEPLPAVARRKNENLVGAKNDDELRNLIKNTASRTVRIGKLLLPTISLCLGLQALDEICS